MLMRFYVLDCTAVSIFTLVFGGITKFTFILPLEVLAEKCFVWSGYERVGILQLPFEVLPTVEY